MAHPVLDVKFSRDCPRYLMISDHVKFIKSLENENDPQHDYLKLSAVYWSLTALDLMNSIDVINKQKIINFLISCKNPDGGFAPSPNHDSHLLSTLSGIQIAILINQMDLINTNKIVEFISSLQNKDGSFSGDVWGEVDTRFAFCALASLWLLDRLDGGAVEGIDFEITAEYLTACQNLDGGFGTCPGSESHAGQAYCVIGAMALMGQLRRLEVDKAAWWLAERQLPSGGLCGRPSKQPDVCYSWWVVASLAILGRIVWINACDLTRFILASQDPDTGGISDRPDNLPDPFHTLFGIAGLSLLSRNVNLESEQTSSRGFECDALKVAHNSLKIVNPVLCMPQYIFDSKGTQIQMLN